MPRRNADNFTPVPQTEAMHAFHHWGSTQPSTVRWASFNRSTTTRGSMETKVELSERIRGLAASSNHIAITSYGLERMNAHRITWRQVELAIQRGQCKGEAPVSDADSRGGLRQVVTMSGEGLTVVIAIVAFQALEIRYAYRPQEIGLLSTNRPYRYAESGLTNIYLQGGVIRHRPREGTFVKISDTQGLHRAIARLLVEGPTPLRGA